MIYYQPKVQQKIRQKVRNMQKTTTLHLKEKKGKVVVKVMDIKWNTKH